MQPPEVRCTKETHYDSETEERLLGIVLRTASTKLWQYTDNFFFSWRAKLDRDTQYERGINNTALNICTAMNILY
jgi:hypothetical protein